MLTTLGNGAGNLLRVKAEGELTQADHVAFLTRLETLIQKYGKARVYCDLEGVHKADDCAAWLDPTSSARYREGVRRFAVVGEEKDRQQLKSLGEAFVNVRYFTTAERDEARRWVRDHAEEDIDQEHIRRLAYAKWEAAGRPPGDGVPYWLEAERELVKTA